MEGRGSNMGEWDAGEGTTRGPSERGSWRQGSRKGQDELGGEQS